MRDTVRLEVSVAKFSDSSAAKLATCHPDLQRLFNAVLQEVDCTVLWGHRGEVEQNEAFNAGTSKLRWPQSMHNKSPSLAADVVPWPIDWDNIARFDEFAVVVKRIAAELKIRVEWGGDWKSFRDRPHWQLATVNVVTHPFK